MWSKIKIKHTYLYSSLILLCYNGNKSWGYPLIIVSSREQGITCTLYWCRSLFAIRN